MTVGQKWLKFKQDGYCGSLTIRSRSEQSFESDPGYNDKHIHEAILEMDPEYTYVKVIHEGYKGSQDIPTIELGNDAEQNQDTLDNAILEGLAHLRIFREANTGAIVQFGYNLDEV
ncbi:hypothetical protein [uncultured Fibrobacter sp.]|uniref:hypothetical protein n=1 Tax=uncultured Fibrobacter sp. TaxID=261512 RepID=UPI0025FCC075|nr:hypothetical protein [uncultured Fibrobacter sp.]